jgi:hypothetical protein
MEKGRKRTRKSTVTGFRNDPHAATLPHTPKEQASDDEEDPCRPSWAWFNRTGPKSGPPLNPPGGEGIGKWMAFDFGEVQLSRLLPRRSPVGLGGHPDRRYFWQVSEFDAEQPIAGYAMKLSRWLPRIFRSVSQDRLVFLVHEQVFGFNGLVGHIRTQPDEIRATSPACEEEQLRHLFFQPPGPQLRSGGEGKIKR